MATLPFLWALQWYNAGIGHIVVLLTAFLDGIAVVSEIKSASESGVLWEELCS